MSIRVVECFAHTRTEEAKPRPHGCAEIHSAAERSSREIHGSHADSRPEGNSPRGSVGIRPDFLECCYARTVLDKFGEQRPTRTKRTRPNRLCTSTPQSASRKGTRMTPSTCAIVSKPWVRCCAYGVEASLPTDVQRRQQRDYDKCWKI